MQYYSGVSYPSSAAALETAERHVPRLADMLGKRPELRMRIVRFQDGILSPNSWSRPAARNGLIDSLFRVPVDA